MINISHIESKCSRTKLIFFVEMDMIVDDNVFDEWDISIWDDDLRFLFDLHMCVYVYGTFEYSCKKNKRWIDAGSHNKQLTSGRPFADLSSDIQYIVRNRHRLNWAFPPRWMLLVFLSNAISLCDKIWTYNITLR